MHVMKVFDFGCKILWMCRRGLSKYYQGKAESFTSLEKVRSLEDLVKPENPYNKKFKSCRSNNGGVMGESEKAKCSTSSSTNGVISKQSSKRGSEKLMVRIPPMVPRRSSTATTLPNQTVLFVWKGWKKQLWI